ncbi:lysophospholipid acyltransferase family protein [Cellulosimicrobium protaetiae]|uniref:1-acyl-sn-glycerol-3-phosphate acyltransferase n=1 Tax=Cellulosimicrobium protaetiae TaxID=2587808 RepID=A0A6M5UFL2_9MICO|nr:lysophospholipid acyltransferase family protein [Cellulosimicrobium protaetiae]QJW36950.1 1-acyl-sn-glycerol-3-phosphate acyltransferase [Cellulosimicrobium protaetiae]
MGADRPGRHTTPRLWSRFDGVFFDVAMAVVRWYGYAVHGLRVTGREHLASERGGVVSVANHVHYLDGPWVAGQFRGRRAAVVSQPSNFHLPVAGVLVSHLLAVPLPRGPGELAAFEARLRRTVDAGQGVHFFPEGALVMYDTTLRPFRRGAFVYACRLGVPVVPMVFTYGRRPWWRPRPPIRLTILPAERGRGSSPADVAELLARCWAAMESVAAGARDDAVRR